MIHLKDPLMSPYAEQLDKFEKQDFLGQNMEPDLIHGIAIGNINPESHEPFKDDPNELIIA